MFIVWWEWTCLFKTSYMKSWYCLCKRIYCTWHNGIYSTASIVSSLSSNTSFFFPIFIIHNVLLVWDLSICVVQEVCMSSPTSMYIYLCKLLCILPCLYVCIFNLMTDLLNVLSFSIYNNVSRYCLLDLKLFIIAYLILLCIY